VENLSVHTVMADVITTDGLHNVRGFKCDFCGDLCDPDTCQLNALTCTFPHCPKECSVYHQDCLEKYLKSIRLEKCVRFPFPFWFA
jgi:hypothetical protein